MKFDVNENPSIVIDTQVFLRAAVRRSSLPGKLVFDKRDAYILMTSKETRAEVIDVLNRPKLRKKFSSLTDESVAEIVAILEDAVDIVVAKVPAISRDPKDDIFLACAVDGKAQYIVTEDND